MRQREVERFRGCLDERLCTVQCRLQHVKCLSCQPGTTSIWTHHTEASNFLGLGEIKEPDPKWNQNKGGGGVILTWAYWDSFSHRSQISLIPSVLGTDSFIPYLHCWIFTSGTTSHPGVQSINQSMKRSMNQFIKSMNQIINKSINESMKQSTNE